MPDSLRTRIAAVIMRRWEYEPSCTCQDCSLEVADAVIRELGLQREDGECLYCHAQLPCGRYVAWDKDTDE